MGEKQELKLLKAIEDYRRIAGRFLLDTAEVLAEELVEYLLAASLRDLASKKLHPPARCAAAAKTVGDLDILVTGRACIEGGPRQKVIDHLLRFPG